MKNFINAFKRAFEKDPEYFDEATKKGGECKTLIKKILDCVKKNFDAAKASAEEFDKNGDPNNEKEKCKEAFGQFITAYDDFVNQVYQKRPKKKDADFIKNLNYLAKDVIPQGDKYFGKDDEPNLATSKVLFICKDYSDKFPDDCLELPQNIKKCFPYF